MTTRDDERGPVRVVRVSELNASVRRTLEREFALLWVAGEISNFTRAASGHWYFQLKDDRAQVRCVMFRNRNQLVGFAPRDGMAVEAFGAVTLYEARGDFQLGIEALREAGVGALYEAFERLKHKLEAEGLFAEARKRPLPAFPRRIGVVTSTRAAALRDVVTTLGRRAPHVEVVIYPTAVQGEGAGANIAAALAAAAARGECDALILCRGGGSIEDLWAFNEEVVARAIAASPIPVVCGVGHETDFTIADFVADRRAPTPTGAAELIAPTRDDLAAGISELARRMRRAAERSLRNRAQSVDYLQRRLIDPRRRVVAERDRLAHIAARLAQAQRQGFETRAARLERCAIRLRRVDTRPLRSALEAIARRAALAVRHRFAAAAPRLAGLEAALQHLNPHAVLERGFSIVRTEGGAIVRSHAQVAHGDGISLVFAEGGADARVEAALPPANSGSADDRGA